VTIRAIGKPAGCKLIRVDAELGPDPDREIMAIRIRGDFFAVPEEGFEKVEAALPGTALAALAVRMDAMLAREGVQVQGISGAAVAEVLEGGVDAP
jgi:hypothetical protein